MNKPLITFTFTFLEESKDNLYYTVNNIAYQAKQLGLNYEIVMVNNNEVDFEFKRLLQFTDNIKWVDFPEVQGSGVARQKAYEMSEGDILFYIDAHVLVDREAIKAMIESAKTNDIIHISMKRWNDTRETYYHYNLKGNLSNEFWGPWSRQPASNKPYPAFSGYGCVAMKREVLDDIGGWPKLEGYGGCEQYVSFLSSMDGKKEVMLPNYYYIHNSEKDWGKASRRDFELYTRNVLKVAYLIAGEEWADKIIPIDSFMRDYDYPEHLQQRIKRRVIKNNRKHRREIVEQFGGDFDKLKRIWHKKKIIY